MPNRDPLLVALGEALRRRREEEHLSQEALSLATSVHRNYIGGVERGERQPSVAVISKLAEALGVRMSHLFQTAEWLLDTGLDRDPEPPPGGTDGR